MTEKSDFSPPGALAEPPRKSTPMARRRSCLEPRVRFWWLLAGVLLIIGVGFIVSAIKEQRREAWLIDHGTKINATILRAGDEEALKRPQPSDSLTTVRFEWKGQAVSPKPRHLDGRTEFITPGDILPIRVNPDDLDEWTWRSEPMPFLTRMTGTVVVMSAAAFAFAFALYLGARTHRIWLRGHVLTAIVVDVQTSPIAPLARLVRVTPDAEGDRRIYTVYVPGRLANLRRGETLLVLRSPSNRGNVVAAAWYE